MTFPKGTAVLKAIAQFSGQTDSYFSSTQDIPPGEHSWVPSLIASERQTAKRSGWLLPSRLTWDQTIWDAALQMTEEPVQVATASSNQHSAFIKMSTRRLSHHPIATGGFDRFLSYFRETVFLWIFYLFFDQTVDRGTRTSSQSRKGGRGAVMVNSKRIHKNAHLAIPRHLG